MSAPANKSAAQAKAAQRWVAPNARPKCLNCKQAEEDRQDRMPPYDVITWRCRLGNFVTAATAVCGQHDPLALNHGGAPCNAGS